VPLYEAEMVTEVETRTADVLTVNVALVAPAGTVTVEGTLAAALSLARATCAPPAGAGPLKVTVPVEDCTPPTTLVGFKVSEETVGSGGGGGVTVRAAVWVTLAKDAEMVTVVDAATALVFTGKVAFVAPAGTVTLEGTLAAPLSLARATCAPPAGAGPLRVTVPVEDCAPPTTVVGFSVSEESVAAGVPVGVPVEEDCSKIKIAGLGSFSESPTNFDGEIT
jgi:hypothetical protein